MQTVTISRRIGLACLLLSCAFSVLWGYIIQRNSPDGMLDFKGVYYGARSIIHHADPFRLGEPLRVCQSEGGDCMQPSGVLTQVLSIHVYFPTVFIVTVPFALLPWGTVYLLWMVIGAIFLCLSAFLIWDLTRDCSPIASLVLLCFLLGNCEAVFATGNTAALAVSLCVVGVWCIFRDRNVAVGILCMALSLDIKPHDAGAIWLCLLLVGGPYRRRALQTLVLSVILGLPGVLWVTHIAPNWMQELHANMMLDAAPGGAVDPGPSTPNSGDGPSVIINLQSTIALAWNDPNIYNPAAYLMCGTLLLFWVILILRSRFSQTNVLLALAAIVPIAMLATYHRSYDAKLLMLAVPVCAILWAERKLTGWLALLVTSAAIVSTADVPLTLLLILNKNLHASAEGVFGKVFAAVLQRPTPLMLVAMGVFYLWVYSRRNNSENDVVNADSVRSAVL